ncbi:MAG TPA: sugar phosphate isomerase/epimerase [Fimbriimonadaceae bacterium]|nr:sugar phosphate isomerase/epimerase [Fimbriimonadaceae bacterium]
MRLSLQLFTIRDAMAADMEGALAAVRATGLEYVELAGYYGKSAADFATILASHGLKVSGSHVGLDDLENHFQTVVDDSEAFGNQWVIVPWVSEERRNWPVLAKTLGELGDRLSARGLKLAYHNHDFEFGPDQGMRQLMANAGEHVKFQIDLGWVLFAGQDPAEFLRDVRGKAPLVHLKDMAPDLDNPHVVAGEGAMNWPSVLEACSETNVLFGAVEMDKPPHDPLTDVKTCVQYFQARGLK